MEKKERHFVLVHGTCHGAWSWYKVATLLKSAGYNVTALDLAASGIHPTQAHELRSLSDYLEPLMEFMASLPADERVILVGHSFGGACISVAMEKFPEKVSVAVYATALMFGPDLNFYAVYDEFFRRIDSLMDSQFTFDQGPNNPPTTGLLGPNLMASKSYQLSPPEDLTLAMSLVRPFRLYGHDALSLKEAELTKEKYGSVHRVYIVCDQDSAIKEDFQRWMIEKNPTDEVKVITGSDHMVMFSKPTELCVCLQEIVEKYS
ncbi:methyl jasmonate esterase 1 [Quercus suber]|uniref:methyl jasmonate esterase 1 n=1 Tax=Quercus suber TaxID=58331 RepID=UPI0032DE6ADE